MTLIPDRVYCIITFDPRRSKNLNREDNETNVWNNNVIVWIQKTWIMPCELFGVFFFFFLCWHLKQHILRHFCYLLEECSNVALDHSLCVSLCRHKNLDNLDLNVAQLVELSGTLL